jgi:hypothetical protein
MRIAYGYNRREADFARLDVDRVYLDMPGSKRVERGAMMQPGALRHGDVIVLVDAGDLGKRQTAAARAMGVSVEVVEPDEPLRRPGAPALFDPNAEQDAYIKTLWINPGYSLRYILERASELMGMDVKRHHLVFRYGNRHKR